jgi:mono/diheme cytochrome c family protein
MKNLAVVFLSATLVGAAQGPKTAKDGVYTETQAARGKLAYEQACAACHQETLEGADLAPALKGDDFLVPWRGRTVQQLLDRIKETMPADAPGSLNAETTADVVAYMLRVNSFPAGSTELTSAGANTITIAR